MSFRTVSNAFKSTQFRSNVNENIAKDLQSLLTKAQHFLSFCINRCIVWLAQDPIKVLEMLVVLSRL
jgi:hypothetical protein